VPAWPMGQISCDAPKKDADLFKNGDRGQTGVNTHQGERRCWRLGHQADAQPLMQKKETASKGTGSWEGRVQGEWGFSRKKYFP